VVEQAQERLAAKDPTLRAKQVKASVAQLLDYFKDFQKVIRLTDRQKAEIVGHKRDEKTGAVVWPQPTVQARNDSTLEDDLAAVDLVTAICAAANPTPDADDRRRAAAELMKKHVREIHGVIERDPLSRGLESGG